MVENNFLKYENAIISSKIILKSSFNFPKIKKIVVFFIISTKYFKKNLILLYIIINLCFYCNLIFYNKEKNNYQVIRFSLRHKKIILFFNNFVNIYLPILDLSYYISRKNIIKQFHFLFYRCYFSSFPVIPESDFLCYNNEIIYNLISHYKVKFDIYLTSICFIKNSLEFLIRLKRLPVLVKLVKN